MTINTISKIHFVDSLDSRILKTIDCGVLPFGQSEKVIAVRDDLKRPA
jgi:hypothetical protein